MCYLKTTSDVSNVKKQYKGQLICLAIIKDIYKGQMSFTNFTAINIDKIVMSYLL